MAKFYTGIGSRDTPQDILDFMAEIATILEKDGWTLRSGAAPGADTGFENGVLKGNKEIYLPWKGFNGSVSPLYSISNNALKIASENHPGWEWLKPAVRKLMARNAYQVKGLTLNKNSSFLMCWTQDGCESHETRTNKTGGTGLAISIASKEGIPIFNLKNKDSLERVKTLLAA